MMEINEIDNEDVKEATEDYYNEYYMNNVVMSNETQFLNQSSMNVTQWKIDLSNNGWTIAQSWLAKNNTGSNVFVSFSDNGGRNYSIPMIVCPGGLDKRTGIYGGEFWVLCTKNVNNVTNVFIQETRTGTTPVSNLTNISVEKLRNATILDFAVNDITGMVVGTWKEGDIIMSNVTSSFMPTYCYRC
jgi:hypothetical protein